MNTPGVKDFFNNKVTVELKNGHKFEGLLSSIDYKNQSLTLEDVEDLGNETDKNFIPHDKKITEKVFEYDNIQEILFKEKHFCEPKKYNKLDFWDATSQPVAQQPKYKQKSYQQKGQKPYYKKSYNNESRGGNQRGDNRRRQNNREGNYNNRPNYKNYGDRNERNDREYNKGEYRKREQQPRKEEEGNDRDYR